MANFAVSMAAATAICSHFLVTEEPLVSAFTAMGRQVSGLSLFNCFFSMQPPFVRRRRPTRAFCRKSHDKRLRSERLGLRSVAVCQQRRRSPLVFCRRARSPPFDWRLCEVTKTTPPARALARARARSQFTTFVRYSRLIKTGVSPAPAAAAAAATKPLTLSRCVQENVYIRCPRCFAFRLYRFDSTIFVRLNRARAQIVCSPAGNRCNEPLENLKYFRLAFYRLFSF